jgi:hypothetical protein
MVSTLPGFCVPDQERTINVVTKSSLVLVALPTT